MSESTRMLLGLALGIIVMILLVMKTKVHSFMALLIAAMITGIIGGMPISDVTLADGTTQTGLITAIQDGFGSHTEKYRYYHWSWSYDGRCS